MSPLIYYVIIFLSEVLTVSHGTDSFFGSRNFTSLQTGNPNIISSIASGTGLAMQHCQHIFKWERWNCPKIVFSRKQQLSPTKETAVAKAMLAAATVYSITKDCSKGQIEGCGCDKSEKHRKLLTFKNFTNRNSRPTTGELKNQTSELWVGCSDDTSFALEIAKKFLNTLDKGFNPPDYVARHNYKVGLELLRTQVIKCRCHGISGSCTMRSCWTQVASFGEISRILKDLHKKAIRVTYSDVQKSMVMGNSARDEFVGEKEIPGTKDRLIYLEQSPDYCLSNAAEGYTGTIGRMCSRNKVNVSKLEKNSCRSLCKKCGHRVKRLQKKVTRRCNCTFTWCCEVKCDTCVDLVKEHFCV